MYTNMNNEQLAKFFALQIAFDFYCRRYEHEKQQEEKWQECWHTFAFRNMSRETVYKISRSYDVM